MKPEDCVLFSGAANGNGRPIWVPSGIAWDGTNARAIVAQTYQVAAGPGMLTAVDGASGDRIDQPTNRHQDADSAGPLGDFDEARDGDERSNCHH